MLSVALLLAAGGLPPSTAACARLDPQVLHTRVEAVLQASDFNESAEASGLLRVYWVSVCADERFGASAAVVDDLARLLEVPDSRWGVASKLLE